MDAQLRLLNSSHLEAAPAEAQPTGVARPSAWRLSADTREIGRQGVAQARAALQSARRPLDDERRSAA